MKTLIKTLTIAVVMSVGLTSLIGCNEPKEVEPKKKIEKEKGEDDEKPKSVKTSIDTTNDNVELKEEVKTETMYVSSQEGLNIREFASTDSNIVDTVSVNSELEVHENFTMDGWKRVTYNDKEYYVHGDYLSNEKVEVEVKEEIVNNVEEVEVPQIKEVQEDDLYYLSRILMKELGCDWISDEMQRMVASVVINRVNSPLYPNTIKEVIFQKGQYSNLGNFYSITPTQKVIDNARYVLENGSVLPPNVLYQSEFPQGNGVYMKYYDEVLNNTTYLCY